jgi:hypothetical protein
MQYHKNYGQLGFAGDVLEPAFDIVEMFHRDRIYMYRSPMKIFENHDKIKVFQPKLLLVINIRQIPGHVRDVQLRYRRG